MLDERKLRVLYAIIDSYISTGEPIGSRTITKKYDIGVSPATIRNEMSDLEDMGYLGKAHSSSGRIPSDKAYRLYVDRFLQEDILNTMHFHQILTADAMTEESTKELVQTAVRMLSQWTQYMAVAAFEVPAQEQLQAVRFLKMEPNVVIMMMTYSHQKTKNHIIHLPIAAHAGDVKALEIRVNQILQQGGEQPLEAYLPETEKYPWMIPMLTVLNHERTMQEAQFVLDGLSNLYNFPEFSEANKAKDFLRFFEDTGAMAELFAHPVSSLDIRIGEENEEERLKETAVLTASYSMTDGNYGRIALIGPTRMNYAKALRAVHMITENLRQFYRNDEGKGESE